MPSIHSEKPRPGRALRSTILCVVLAGMPLTAVAQRSDAGPPASPESNPKVFLEQLSGDLKIAVRVQAMNEADARAVYEAASNLIGQGTSSKDGMSDDNDWRSGDDGQHLWFTMRIPEGGSFDTLLRPEFLRRDIQLVVNRLELDETTAPIAEIVLLEYEEAFNAEASRFQQSLDQGTLQVELASLGSGARATDPANWPAIEGRIVNSMAERGATEEKIQGTVAWVDARFEGMRQRLALLQPIADRRWAAMDVAGGLVDSRSVLASMNRLELARRELRSTTVDSLRTVIEADREATFELVLDEIRIHHGMADSRMGGATTDLAEAFRSIGPAEFEAGKLEDLRRRAMSEVAMLFDARTEARIRREKQALELTIDVLENGTDGGAKSRSAVRSAATAELTAELAVRDTLLSVIELVRERLERINPDAAAMFIDVARRSGFRAQMRPRWCELAIDDAMGLDDLDQDGQISITEIVADMEPQLGFLRTDAIQRRLNAETRVARAMVEAVVDDGVEAKSLGEAAWKEPGYEGFDRLDDQIESQLLTILGPDRFDELPRRRGSSKEKTEEKAKKPAAKNEQKRVRNDGGKGK